MLGYALGRLAGTVPVLFGVTGDESRLEFTVIGDVVNVAAKLEKHSKAVARPGKATGLATADALALAREQGFEGADRFEPMPGQRVAGIGHPLDIVAMG